MVRSILIVTMALFMFGGARTALAGPALDSLKDPIERVVAILGDPRYQAGDKNGEQKEQLWKIAREVFDFEAIARGTLKRHRWKSFTPQQREAFTDVFTTFLGNSYFSQIQGKYRNEKVEFIEEVVKSPKKALVKTKIVRETLEIPVDYSMWLRNGKWRIYNVNIEGASLLGNYRNEFERVLQKDSPGHLIDLLREKNENLLKTGDTKEGQ